MAGSLAAGRVLLPPISVSVELRARLFALAAGRSTSAVDLMRAWVLAGLAAAEDDAACRAARVVARGRRKPTRGR